MKEFAVGGWYSFLTYAALHWADHLEHWVENCGDAQAVKKIEQQIQDFLQKHWSKANLQIAISKNLRQKFKLFQECDIFDGLLRAISVWKKQCTSFGLSSAVPEELELLEHIIRSRRALELLSGSATENKGLQRKLSTYYGPRLYKCPRLSCNFFTEGFEKRSQRDFHLKKHDRGFTCTYPSCPYGILGVKTKNELEKHIASHCSRIEAEIESFPVTRDPKSIDIKQAIRYSLEEEIERWLQQFGGIYDRKSYDSGVFLPVIAKGDVAIVDIFLKHAGGITASDLSELCNLAMRAQQDDIAIHFLCHKLGDPLQPAFRDQRPGNLCSQPASVAIHYGRAKVLRYMIRNCGIKPNTRTSNQPSSSLLFEAFASRRLEIVNTLVAANGRYTDTLERSQNVAAALCIAIEKGDEDIIREMVGHKDCNLDFPTEKGTPIHLAIQCRSATTVKILLKTGKCNINIGDDIGNTPLHEACRCGYEYIVLLLLKVANCDMNIRNKAERTALHEAINSGHFSVANMLLGTGKCSVDTRDTLGNTPLDTAVTHHRKGIRRYLKKGISRSNSAKNNGFDEATENCVISIIKMLFGCGKYDDFSNDDCSRKKLVEGEGHEDILGIFLQIELQKRENTWDPIVEFFEAVKLGRTTRVKVLLANDEIPAGMIAVSLNADPHFGRFSWVHLSDEDPENGVLTDREDIIRLLTLDPVSTEEIANLTKHYSLSSPSAVTEDVNHLSSPFQYSDDSLEKLTLQNADNASVDTGEQEVCEHKDIVEGVCFDCWKTFPIYYMPPVLPGNPVVVPPLDITPQESNC